MLADAGDAQAAANATVLNPTGTLRLTASLSFSVHHIAPLLKDHANHYSNVNAHVEVSNRYYDLIDNNIDVAISTREFENDSNITIRRLACTRRILAVRQLLSPPGCADGAAPHRPQTGCGAGREGMRHAATARDQAKTRAGV